VSEENSRKTAYRFRFVDPSSPGVSPVTMPDTAPDPDGERMRRWASGDRTAFEEIVRAWQGPVGRFLVRLTGDVEQASDLVQEAFLRVYLNGAKYTHGGQFKTWLYQIALNLARDAARRAARKPVAKLTQSHDPPGDTGVSFEQRERAEVVTAALATLPAHLREVVVLRHYEGLNFEAMGRLLGVPATTLKSRFAVAMKKLEEVLVPKLS
jgi:RNA polymerase sigma-70 factor (ECF subfamily)